MATSKSVPCFARPESESSSASEPRQPAKRLHLHDSNIAPQERVSTNDRARKASVKLRTLCCELASQGLRHDEIAKEIGANPRTLSSWKAGVTVPHWAIDALESAVMRVSKKVGGV